MAESIESMRRASLEVVNLAIDSIDPDPENPNAVPPALLDALRADIKRGGFVQPIVVRPEGGRWRLIDGEHRWRILKEQGVKTVPAVIDDAGEEEGRMRLLTLNGLRGEPNPVRQARLLARLSDELGEDELRKRLGMDEEEWDTALALKDVPDDLDERLAKALAEEERKAPVVLRYRMGPRQARTVGRVLDTLTEKGDRTRAEALIDILSR